MTVTSPSNQRDVTGRAPSGIYDYASSSSTSSAATKQSHRMVITETGRVKMIHAGSRKITWEAPADEHPVLDRPPTNDAAAAPPAETAKTLHFVCRPSACLDVVEKERRTAENQRASLDHITSIVEFDVSEVLALENDGVQEVKVRRSGNLEGRVKCEWSMTNGNVLPALYDALSPQQGIVQFEEGQQIATLRLPVPDDPTWNVESVYFARIRVSPDSKGHTIVGANARCGVYSLNVTPFPANVPPRSPASKILWGFVVHNFTELPREAELGILYAIFPAISYYASAMILKLLLDCGIKENEECDLWGMQFAGGRTVLLPLAAMEVLIFLMDFIVSRLTIKLRLGGKAVRMLRANMFATMLQLSADSKQMFDQGDVPKALDTQVVMAINSVWLPFFKLVTAVLELSFKWFITMQTVWGADTISLSAKVIVYGSSPVMLCIVGLLLNRRGKQQFQLYQKSLVADDNWSAFVIMCESCCAAILNYQQGYNVSKTFNEVHARFNKASAAAGDYSTLSIWLMKICFKLILAIVIVIGGFSALDGYLGVGGFVVLIQAVKGFGDTLVTVGETINEMVIGSAAVRKVADILNMETRRRVRLRRESAGLPGFQWSKDSTDIVLKDIWYSYPNSNSDGVLAIPPIRLTIPAGHLVCFSRNEMNKAPEGGVGIQTLFKMMIRELFPGDGYMNYPSRWSLVCVPVVPLLFDGSLMYNLAYSARSAPPNVAWTVAEDLGLSSNLLGKEDLDVGSNGETLKFADRVVVSIARAIIADTDMLLMEAAIDVLGEKHGAHVLRYLKGYIDSRGVPGYDFEQRPKHLRHQKTVLFPSKYEALQQEAELVVCFEDERTSSKPDSGDTYERVDNRQKTFNGIGASNFLETLVKQKRSSRAKQVFSKQLSKTNVPGKSDQQACLVADVDEPVSANGSLMEGPLKDDLMSHSKKENAPGDVNVNDSKPPSSEDCKIEIPANDTPAILPDSYYTCWQDL